MSETHANDVHGPVQSGSFSGPVQTVTVTTPEPPQNLRDQIQEIWITVVKSELERHDRQKALDRQLAEIASQIRDISARVFRMEYTTLAAVVISTSALMLGIGMLLWMAVTR